MALTRIKSFITSKIAIKTKNEVMPIQITVRPKEKECSVDGGTQVSNNVCVFAVEDELGYSRLWYPNDNRNHCAVAIPCELRPCKENTGEFIEISELPLGPKLDEENIASQNALNAPSNHTRFHPLQTLSTQFIRVKNFSLNIWSCVTPSSTNKSKAKPMTIPQNYIHSYLGMMLLCFVSAVRTCNNQPNNVVHTQTWLRWMGSQLQLVIFVLFTLLSAFQSFCQAKYNVLWFLFQGGINRFVKFSFYITSLVTSAYCSYLLCHEWKVMKKMADVMSSYERNWAYVTKKPVICVVLAIITVLLSLLRSLLIIDMEDFSVEDAMLESSYQMSEDLFLWSSHNLNLSIQKLDEEFGNELGSIETLLAVVKILRDFAYYLQDGMMWDLIVCVVFTLFCWTKFYMRFVMEVVDNILDESSEEWRVLQRKRELVWKMYRENRTVFEAVNNVFDTLLIFFHASNVLRYAFFMENLIYPGSLNFLTYVHLLYNIVKSEVTYILASRIAQQNKVIRKWLRNWGSRAGRIDVGYTEIDINVVLDELDEEPLGLGKGEFMIHQGFHFGLFGLVSSLFVTLASKKP